MVDQRQRLIAWFYWSDLNYLSSLLNYQVTETAGSYSCVPILPKGVLISFLPFFFFIRWPSFISVIFCFKNCISFYSVRRFLQNSFLNSRVRLYCPHKEIRCVNNLCLGTMWYSVWQKNMSTIDCKKQMSLIGLSLNKVLSIIDNPSQVYSNSSFSDRWTTLVRHQISHKYFGIMLSCSCFFL